MGASTEQFSSSGAADPTGVIIKTAKKTLKRQESGSMKIKSLAKTVMEKIHSKSSDDEKKGGVGGLGGVGGVAEVTTCKDTVRKLIQESDAFEVDGKMVMLIGSKSGNGKEEGKEGKEKKKSKKRKSVESMESSARGDNDSSQEEKKSDGDDADDDVAVDRAVDKKAAKAAKKAAKRAKKEKKEKDKNTTSGSDNGSKKGGGGGAGSGYGTDSSDFETTQKWRNENKIILKDSRTNITATTSEEITEESKQRNIKINKELISNHSYYPYTSFDAPGLKEKVPSPLIKECTVVNGFERPSPIQAQCWPVLLHTDSKGRHRDVVGIAETGSGKTLAFAIPALSALAQTTNGPSKGSSSKRGRSPRMLVLAPTRELAQQSHVVLSQFGTSLSTHDSSYQPIVSTVIYGGIPKHAQRDQLRKGVDCIVATPGRLKDLINEGACNLSEVTFLVLDEADRMLDMGFEEDVRFIIGQCKEKSPKEGRQTAMFSATWPAAIQNLAMEYMVDPVCIYVGFEALTTGDGDGDKDHHAAGSIVDDSLSANKRVSQTVEVIEDRAREPRLRELLQKFSSKTKNTNSNNDDRILVFALYKKEAARLETTISRWNYHCSSIHGDKSQEARNRALAEFKDGSCPILVATDVAARGLDIPDVEVVINYTFPLTIEDYVHRIGRTGRAGKYGRSHTFFQPGDKSHAGELQAVMRQANQVVPEELMKFGSTIKKKEHKLYGNFGPRVGGGEPMRKAVKITFDSDGE